MKTIILVYQADTMELLHTIDSDRCSDCTITKSVIEYQKNIYTIKNVLSITQINDIEIRSYMVYVARYKWALSINGIANCESGITFSNEKQCYGDMQHVAIERLKKISNYDNLSSCFTDNYSIELNKNFIKIKENDKTYLYKIIQV